MFKVFKVLTFVFLATGTTFGHCAVDNIKGHLGALSNQVTNQVGNVPGNRYNADFEFDYHRKTRLESRFHLAAMINDQSLTMYSFEEAYIGGNLTSKDRVVFGRHILKWSEVDHTWGFGKLNNRRNFDFFVPGQEGLIGASYERKSSDGMRYKLFASGLYVPETNPSLDVNNGTGKITSRHAWSDPPPARGETNTISLPIKYKVNYPEVSDIIYRYSIGANIGHETDHWVFDNFIIRKPENNVTTDAQVDADFVLNVANVTINPSVYYHDVYGSNLKYRNQDIAIYVSAIGIRPNEFPDVPELVRITELRNKKRREAYAGGGISRSNDLYTLAFNYVARLSPFDRLTDDLSPNPRWNQALNVYGARNFAKHYSVSTDVKFDMLTTDRLVMVRANYKASKDLLLSVGINLIGTPTDGKSYWSPYKNNDSINGGLKYVF